jgi:uncharacterized membrane protein YphA (DoxX/SURF4 family)
MIRIVKLVLRIALAAVFAYAAYTKLRQPWLVFAMSIDAYGLLPEWAVLFIARTLPWFELAIGVGLLIGIWLRYVSLAATLLLAVFFGIMLMSYGKGMGIDCGCFGVGEPLTAKTLVRDGSLLVAAVVLTVLSFQRRRLADTSAPVGQPATIP